MNDSTLVSAHCYAGDSSQVQMLLPVYEHHNQPIVILSPEDSPVRSMGPHICRQAGKRAYIGQDSLDRQILHLKILLQYDFAFYLLNDSDSFCVSAEIPKQLYEYENTLWSNEVFEPRPHESKYPKLAFQPPYFLTRKTLEKIVAIAPTVPCHPITPYIDFFMNAAACEAGLVNRAFMELEHPAKHEFTGSDPWDTLDFRIRHRGAVMMHPIKTSEQAQRCVKAREFYEQSR